VTFLFLSILSFCLLIQGSRSVLNFDESRSGRTKNIRIRPDRDPQNWLKDRTNYIYQVYYSIHGHCTNLYSIPTTQKNVEYRKIKTMFQKMKGYLKILQLFHLYLMIFRTGGREKEYMCVLIIKVK
jgi:hypothetical protein